jgi:flagellar motor switch protein FliN
MNDLRHDPLFNLEQRPLEFFGDVALTVSAEFGRAELTIRQLLNLRTGSVLELNKREGEGIDVKVNGNPVARGEVVVVNDKYGIRMTEVQQP